MKILIIDLGYGVGTAKSGGSTRLLEVMKRLDPQQFSLHFLTSDGGKTLYNEENLEYPTTVVRSSFLFDVEKNKYQRLISYFISIVSTFFNYQKLPKVDAVYSASDYICDIIPALFIKKRMNISFYAFVHHLCKRPQQRQGNKLINLISYLGQKLSFNIIG